MYCYVFLSSEPNNPHESKSNLNCETVEFLLVVTAKHMTFFCLFSISSVFKKIFKAL